MCVAAKQINKCALTTCARVCTYEFIQFHSFAYQIGSKIHTKKINRDGLWIDKALTQPIVVQTQRKHAQIQKATLEPGLILE